MWPWVIGIAAVAVSGGVITTIVRKRRKQTVPFNKNFGRGKAHVAVDHRYRHSGHCDNYYCDRSKEA